MKDEHHDTIYQKPGSSAEQPTLIRATLFDRTKCILNSSPRFLWTLSSVDLPVALSINKQMYQPNNCEPTVSQRGNFPQPDRPRLPSPVPTQQWETQAIQSPAHFPGSSIIQFFNSLEIVACNGHWSCFSSLPALLRHRLCCSGGCNRCGPRSRSLVPCSSTRVNVGLAGP